jgi:hypothetical protein
MALSSARGFAARNASAFAPQHRPCLDREVRMRLILPIAIGVVVAGLLIVAVARARRRRDIPELNKHPERLEQSLDQSDDA